MAEATPDTLLDKALAQAPSGRNDAGKGLAQQLHWNRYSEPDAEAVMLRYAAAVRNTGDGIYSDQEARRTLKAEYRQPIGDHEPWSSGNGGQARQDRKAHQLRQAFPTAPPARHDPEPNPESVKRFTEQIKTLEALAGSPAETYLVGRGIPLDLAKAARCKYSPQWGKIGSAVVFPIIDENGRTVAAAGRAVAGNGKQTFGPLSLGIFATPGAMEADPVAITEAPIDALSLALAGLPAFAVCGTRGLPAWLIKRLATPARNTPAGHSRTVCQAFDNDPAGEEAAARIGAALPLARTLRLRPAAKDWNADLTTGDLDSLCERLKNAGIYKDPSESPDASESQREAVSVGYTCGRCGRPVTLHDFSEPGPWKWYECDSCGESKAVLSIPEQSASESKPAALVEDHEPGLFPTEDEAVITPQKGRTHRPHA